MEALISQGASVTVKDNVTKRTPLHASGERALMLHLWYKPYNTEAFTFTYLLSLCTFLLNGRRRFWHVLRTAACLLRSYSEPFIFHFLGLFSSVPMVQSSLTQNPVFFHTTASHPYLLASTLPCLSITTYSKMGKREHLPHCFSYRRKVENTGRLWLVMQLSWCSKLPTFCSGNTREIHPFQTLPSSWASLWTCSCWESAPFLICWVLIMQRA